MKIRVLGIALLCVATAFLLGRILLAPSWIERPRAPVVFPREAPVPRWRATADAPTPALPNTARYRLDAGDRALELEIQFIPDPANHYVYNPLLELRFLPRGHLPLDAGLHFYLSSRGRIIGNLRSAPPIDALVEIRSTSPQRAHGLWTAEGRLHLTSILTPGGAAGIAPQRVARSLYLDPLDSSLVWRWLLGRANFPDRRCVLFHFSAPAPSEDSEEGRRVLEGAWAEWQRVYTPIFPEAD